MAAEVAQGLMWGPKRMKDLADFMGMRKSELLRKYVREFRALGCVYISGWAKRSSPIFAWNPTPFANPDTPRPAYTRNT
jgi:hypothetical protein